MAIASIISWLNDPLRQYTVGLAIYEQYGSNQVTLSLLKSGSGSYHFSKLQKALEDLNLQGNLVPKPIVVGEYTPEQITSSKRTKLDYEAAPDQVVEIRDQKNKSFAQARKLFEVIRVMDDQAHRLAAGLELLDHMDNVNEAWAAIDQWQETGEVKQIQVQESDIAVKDLSFAQLLQESKNLPPRITNTKKTLAESKKQNIILKAGARLKYMKMRLAEVRERMTNELV